MPKLTPRYRKITRSKLPFMGIETNPKDRSKSLPLAAGFQITPTNFNSLIQAIAQASKTAQLHLVGGCFCQPILVKWIISPRIGLNIRIKKLKLPPPRHSIISYKNNKKITNNQKGTLVSVLFLHFSVDCFGFSASEIRATREINRNIPWNPGGVHNKILTSMAEGNNPKNNFHNGLL